MSISLSSCFPSQFSQNNNFSDRQSFFNDSSLNQAHDFSKDINQMENMITSMEEMSKDIRSHLLDLQTMPGANNANSHLQQQSQHLELVVEDQIRSSLHRLSPVIMQSNRLLETTKPYPTIQQKHELSPRETHSIITGGSSQGRSDFAFCTPSAFTEEHEMRNQAGSENIKSCRRKLQFDRDSGGKTGFGNCNLFPKEEQSHRNQNAMTGELNGSHFTACLDQGFKKSPPKENPIDSLVKKPNQIEMNLAKEARENSQVFGLESSQEKSEEMSENSYKNVELKDLVSQAAKLLDNNGADLGIDTDSMVDSMLSEIREAFNQNVEKVFKDVNTSELLFKKSQPPKSKMSASNTIGHDSDILFGCENSKEQEMSEDNVNMDYADQGYYNYYSSRAPPPPPSLSSIDSGFDLSSMQNRAASKQAWGEVKQNRVLWSNGRRKKKKKEMQEEEEEEEDDHVDEEEDELEDVFCPYISGGIRPQKTNKYERSHGRKNWDPEKKNCYHQKYKGTKSCESEDTCYPLLSDMDDNHNSSETGEKTNGQYYNKTFSKHRRYPLRKNQYDKKARGVHFSDTVHLIEENDGEMVESQILMPKEKLDDGSRSSYEKYSTSGGHSDVKSQKRYGKKLSNNNYECDSNQRQEDDLSYEAETGSQKKTMHDKSVMTPWESSKSKRGGSSISAWTKDCWKENSPSSPRTRTENWKCNSRIDDEQNGIFKSLTIESVSTEKPLSQNPWNSSGNTFSGKRQEPWQNLNNQQHNPSHAKKVANDHKKDNSNKKGTSDFSIAGGCGPDFWEHHEKGFFPGWQAFDQPENNLNCPSSPTDSQMAFVCCILPQNVCNSSNQNSNNSENVYISNMMLTDLKGEDFKNPQKIGQPIEASEAKKVSYLVRELMEHLQANENFSNKSPNKETPSGKGSSPSGRRMSWVDAVNPDKCNSSRLTQCGSPVLFCYLPPEFLPKAHQVKSVKKPTKDLVGREKGLKKSPSLHKGCQTESNRIVNNNNGGGVGSTREGVSWWISAPPRVKKKPTSRIQQIYSNKLPPPVPLVNVKSIGKESRSSTPERKPKPTQLPYTKKPKLGLNASPMKKKPFVI